MAGTKNLGDFNELISPFLKNKIENIKSEYGENSAEYNSIAKQYIKTEIEKKILNDEKKRHYYSELEIYFHNKKLEGVERLYKRTVLIEPTTVCAAHCRWCLRGQYPIKTLSEDDIDLATKYFGSEDLKKDVDEVLITGGDPLMSLPKLKETLNKIKINAPNIKIIRIGTRVPFQDPRRVNDDMLNIFSTFRNFRFEIGINVNHPLEFWPESIEAIQRLKKLNITIYNQNPLLKGVNDNFETLARLYDLLRQNEIEAHYLFHAIPLAGMSHHRTSLKKGYDLIGRLSSSGEFSGRSKPKYAVLSDIGKIVIYENTIIEVDKSNNNILLQSGFKFEDRIKWNPSWKKSESILIDKNGFMQTWYKDGMDN
jgi:lysine 2,3-aminomutase